MAPIANCFSKRNRKNSQQYLTLNALSESKMEKQGHKSITSREHNGSNCHTNKSHCTEFLSDANKNIMMNIDTNFQKEREKPSF
jgi:hypothetical protein